MAKKLSKQQKLEKQRQLTIEQATPQNFVAKFARQFNKATVEQDRKKQAKKNGYINTKHKGNRDW